jgi:hypothetical protein
MPWSPDLPESFEAEKIKYLIVPYTRGVGLDIGCGPRKAFPHFIGVDNGGHAEMFGIQSRPDIAADGTRLTMFADASVDFVFSSHFLEHVEDYRAALAEWWRVIKVGGHLVLYLPHKRLYPNIGVKGANPDHKHDFLPSDIEANMRSLGALGWDMLVNEERNGPGEYSFLQVYRKRDDQQRLLPPPRPAKTACVVRYGGYGDQLQASGVLPELKRQGFHVTMNVDTRGEETLRHDPHIDAWMVQDKDQVPLPELPAYWKALATRFDRFVNLSESVEATFLAVPGRTNHEWPDAVRRKYLDVNYGEFIADLAGVEFRPEARFYPSAEEKAWAVDYLRGCAGQAAGPLLIARTPPVFSIMWALAGTSVHKFYPGMDAVIARVMLEMPEAHVITVGEPLCALLEAGWEKERRVHRESGRLAIRQSLALAQVCNVVVGPETGVLNAVAHEANRKVVLLSHSTANNLTKHWINTAALVPKVPCYPCHRLHYTREWCPEDKQTGASVCAVSIQPDAVVAAIRAEYDAWRALRKEAA